MMNTGAETIRIDRSYMPVLLQLKTVGAIGPDEASTKALARLEAADLLRAGRLHPMAEAVFESVVDPALVVSVERMRLGAVATSTIWATPSGATIGTRVDGEVYELKLANVALLPFHIFELIHLRPLPQAAPVDITLPSAAMLAVEALLHDNKGDGAMQELKAAGVGDDAAAAAIAILGSRVASWRVHSVWSTKDGNETRQCHGLDCGPRGHILAALGPETTTRLRGVTFAEVTAALRSALPSSQR
jgi:hypothetical protein